MSYIVEDIVISLETEEVEELICALDFVMTKTNEFNIGELLTKFKQSLNTTQTKWYDKTEEESDADYT